MLDNIIQTFWYGPLSWFEEECLASFVRHNYEVHLYVFNPEEYQIKGVTVLDAAPIMPEKDVVHYQKERGLGRTNSIALTSDIFRARLLFLKGGWWVDCDVFCLRRFPYRGQSVIVGREDSSLINTAVMFAVPKSEIMRRLAEIAEGLGEMAVWGDAGPKALTSLVARAEGDCAVMDSYTFYPIHYSECAAYLLFPWLRFIAEQRIASCYFFHLYKSSLSPALCRIPKGSLLFSLFLSTRIGCERSGITRWIFFIAKPFVLFKLRRIKATLRYGSWNRQTRLGDCEKG